MGSPAIGVVFGLALLAKAIGIFALPAVATSLWLSGNSFKIDARRWLLAIGAGAVPLGAVVLVYAANGDVSDLVYGNWTYNRLYSEGQSPSILGYFQVQERREAILWFAAASIGVGLAAATLTRQRQKAAFVLAIWAVGMWVAAKYGGRDYGHYFVPVIAPASMLFAATVPSPRTGPAGERALGVIGIALVALATLPLLVQVVDNMNESGESLAFKTYGAQAEVWAQYEPVGKRIATLAAPGDELYVSSLEPGFIWASGLAPASRHIHASAPEQIPEVGAAVDLELCVDPPEWAVIFDRAWPPYLVRFDQSQYVPALTEGNVTVLRRSTDSPPMSC